MQLANNETCTSCVAFFPLLTTFLMMIGAVCLFRKKQWRTIAAVTAATGPLLFVYASQIRLSPLYYLTGFFACLGLAGFDGIASAGRRTKIGLATVAGVLFLVQYPLGINVALRSKPWYPAAEPTLVRLWEKDLDHGPLAKITLGIGPGGAVPNLERVRFCSGLLFHSLAFHTAKQALLEGFSAMKEGIRR